LDPSSIITSDHPKYNILASHVQLPLRNDKLITVMLLQKPLSKKDVTEWIQTKSSSITTTIPEQEKVDEFIKNYKKNTPKSIDQASNKFLDFLDDLQIDEKDKLDMIESYLCNQLYDQLFTNPDGDEAMQDEALESRIAALNLLDLDLNHLGVLLQEKQDVENMNQIVKLAGTQLQQLNTIMGAKEKLDALIKTHEIIVNAIDEFVANANSNTAAAAAAAAATEETEVVQQEIKQAISTTTSSTITSANADVLLPILIFTIVKSNPTHFLSNLKFITRFRRPEELNGQASYCLTNMVRKKKGAFFFFLLLIIYTKYYYYRWLQYHF
jgi:ribosomal protein L12E/L44/L45/RPP1/RPP2